MELVWTVVKSEDKQYIPYKKLGSRLRQIRQQLRESVAEVSGAIEIDESTLGRIERGQERPSEDILLLLISHFSMSDDDAVVLWELAGYDQSLANPKSGEEGQNGRPLLMVMALDSRIIYSDSVQVVANPNGVVLNFLQAPDGPYTAQTIARIGMSREQAESVVKVLQQTLKQSSEVLNGQKLLPSPQKENKRKPNTPA